MPRTSKARKLAAARARAAPRKTKVSLPLTDNGSPNAHASEADPLEEESNEIVAIHPNSASKSDSSGYRGHCTVEKSISTDRERLNLTLDGEKPASKGSRNPCGETMASNWNVVFAQKLSVEWRNAERKRELGYSGLSERTKQRRYKVARNEAAVRAEAKTCENPQVVLMRNMFVLQAGSPATEREDSKSIGSHMQMV
ncbi:hypothetical protein M404DRAFT_385419 [Pisolithus tinctorius Marx 270]|uniref:Uncharacterized protein n=1 Tax=Pisolithus tinctorius Marx 270 TaxID=870435 RepID=A0A0C3NF35_PISTI|nr:hypothetical protein M404DRAFT_385419 [Pisolithus tinctorius Marx 270]